MSCNKYLLQTLFGTLTLASFWCQNKVVSYTNDYIYNNVHVIFANINMVSRFQFGQVWFDFDPNIHDIYFKSFILYGCNLNVLHAGLM